MTNPTMSRFRVKKLSPKHPLPVYKDSQLPDIHEATNQQRAALQIETGVEKEEETEVRIRLQSDWQFCPTLDAGLVGGGGRKLGV